MTKEVLIYGPIDYYSSTEFFKQVAEATEENPDGEIVYRINTGGGEPEYGWGIIAKIQETKNKRIKVDGKAHSMGLFTMCYVDDVECLDVSQFLLHRAAYPSWFENDPSFFTDVLKSNLENVNASLEKSFRNKIDVASFEEMKGVKVKDIFSMDSRKEVILTAQEAKKIGLVKNIVKITPTKQAEINSHMAKIAAQYEGVAIAAEETKNQNMTIEKFQSEHPEIYAKIVEVGVKKERDRVGAWMAFAEVDVKEVAKSIKEGAELSQTAMAEFSKKMFSNSRLGAIEGDNPTAVATTEVKEKEKTEKDKEVKAFMDGVDKYLKVV